jgi:hypothetical protein
MRLARFLPLLVLLVISGCSAIAGSPTPTLTDLELMGIPQTPIGMMPETRDPDSTAMPTMQPVDFGGGQSVTMPELGLTMTIPSSWSIEQIDPTSYEIRDADEHPVIRVGEATGFPMSADGLKEELTKVLVQQGALTRDFDIEPDVVGINAWVRLRGAAIDACEYRYLPGLFNYFVFKFEQGLCDENNILNSTGFGILRSIQLSTPTQ